MNDVQKEQREDALLRYYGKCPVCGKSIMEEINDTAHNA